MRYAVAGLLVIFAVPARAQHRADRALDSLGDAAAQAAIRFVDRRVAAADGYHRIGPDFPGMGEHWLHPATLLTGRVSAEQPTILMFATIAGQPTLLGVGFVTTTDRLHPTRDLPGWPGAWHEHSGLLSDESGVAPGENTQGDTHVWVLHVWTTLPNADGRFVPDNWALPFLRAGLVAPVGLNADAARALALASSGDRYVRDVLTDANARTSVNAARVDSAIARATTTVERIVAARTGNQSLTASGVNALVGTWRELLAALESIVGESVARYLAPAHAMPFAHVHEGGQ